MRSRRLLALCALLLLAACSRGETGKRVSDATPSPALSPFPAGPLAEPAAFAFTLYYLPTPAREPRRALEAILRSRPRWVRLDGETAARDASATMTFAELQVKDAPPPDAESLRYIGRGLSDSDVERLQSSKTAVSLGFQAPRDARLRTLREAARLVHELAVRTGGLVWDAETREMF